MALLQANEIDAGGGYITDRGNWVSGFKETVDGISFTGYALNDRVHTSKGIYLSLKDDNTTNPDTDATGAWRLDFSFAAVTAATTAANNAATAANKAKTDSDAQTAKCKEQTDLAAELNTHQPKVGEDGYWYYWDSTNDTWVKTDTLANGGMIMPSVYRSNNDLVIDGGVGDPTGKFVKENNSLIINF
ncbi:MAG: hypothetical protein ACI3YZ_06545 [Prevotella sp.]